MSKGIKFIFAFGLGVAAGVVATQRFFKAKYEAISQEEIDSVKETYRKKLDTIQEVCSVKKKYDDMEKEEKYVPTDEDEETYEELRNRYSGTSYIGKKGGSEDMKDYIEVIPPDEFGQDDDYDCIGFTYYANDILTDDGDFPIDEPEAIIGPDALDSFGEYEDDTVYVRNDDRRCYYEICRDNSDYDPQDVDE